MSVAQIKNTYSSVGEIDASVPPSSLVLKLAVSRHAVNYFIQSLTHGQVIFYGEYVLHHVENENDLSARLEKIFNDDQSLQLSFGKVIVGIDSDYALVPSGIFLPVENLGGVSITQMLGNSDMEIVFNVGEPVNNKLRALFPGSKIVHLNSAFVNTLPGYLSKSTDKLFANINPQHFDVIRFTSERQLQLMNRYEYKAASDFLYFVLLCCEQLQIGPAETEFVLMGGVDIQSKIYGTCYHYFPNISFIQQPENARFSKAFDRFPRHLHFNLYNLES